MNIEPLVSQGRGQESRFGRLKPIAKLRELDRVFSALISPSL